MEEQEQLVRRMQQGDEDAFDQIFARYRDQLLRTAFLICGNHADSEDIVQETFVKCYCQCGKLREPARFTAWLYHILTRTAWRHEKKRKRETPVEELYEAGEPESGDLTVEQLLLREQREELYRKILALNPKHRTVVILYYFDELSTREISRILGCLEGTVKSRLYTARRLLERELREEQKEWIRQHLTG